MLRLILARPSDAGLEVYAYVYVSQRGFEALASGSTTSVPEPYWV
jgi:hypothetical protein